MSLAGSDASISLRVAGLTDPTSNSGPGSDGIGSAAGNWGSLFPKRSLRHAIW
jgi:hypothetical protein